MMDDSAKPRNRLGFAGRWHWILLAAVIVGIAERLGWAWRKGLVATSAPGEMLHAAASVATKGQIADVLHVGQGPSAHVMPITPLIAGAVYRLLGVNTAPAEFVLLCISTAIVFGAYALAYLSFRALGVPRTARRCALLMLLVFPLNLGLEAQWFRIWEGGLAVLAEFAFLLLLLRYDRTDRHDVRASVGLSLAAAVLLFISPPLGVPAYLAALLFMLFRQPWTEWARTAVIATGCLGLVFAPWVIRNHSEFGKFIPLRSNFGLEYALGVFPGAVDPVNPSKAFRTRIDAIHPMHNEAAYARMLQRGGETGYAHSLADETSAFVKAHPADAARIMFRHFREFLFPPPWMWRADDDQSRRGYGQMVIHWAIVALGFLGVAWGCSRGERRYVYIALMLTVPALVYMVTQPSVRYHYVIFVTATFAAWDLLLRLYRKLGSSSADDGHQPPFVVPTREPAG